MAPASAAAQVAVQPTEAAAGRLTFFDVLVANERDDAATMSIDLELPVGFVFSSFKPVPGWKISLRRQDLAKPVQGDDGPITSEIREITWTAFTDEDRIQPEKFQSFPIAGELSAPAGRALPFHVIQTYDPGDAVSWSGSPGSAEPAPRVLVSEGPGDADGSDGASEG